MNRRKELNRTRTIEVIKKTIGVILLLQFFPMIMLLACGDGPNSLTPLQAYLSGWFLNILFIIMISAIALISWLLD